MMLRNTTSKGRKSSSGLIACARPVTGFSTIIATHIRHLVKSLGDSPQSAAQQELLHIASLYGPDAHVLMLRCLVDELTTSPAPEGLKEKTSLFKDQLAKVCRQPSFASTVCQAFSGDGWTEEKISALAKTAKLPQATEVALGVALANHVEADTVGREACRFLRTRLSEAESQRRQVALPDSLLHHALSVVDGRDDLRPLRHVLARSQQAQPSPALLLALGAEPVPAPSPVTSPSSIAALALGVLHPAALLLDLGFASTATPTAFKAVIDQYPKPLSESDVALILGALAKPVTPQLKDGVQLFLSAPGGSSSAPGLVIPPGQPQQQQQQQQQQDQTKASGWNITAVADVLKDTCPKLNWGLVAKSLDHPGFQVQDQRGLGVIVEVFRRCSKDAFPVSLLFEEWQNRAGQLSLLRAALASPELMNLSSSSSSSAVTPASVAAIAPSATKPVAGSPQPTLAAAAALAAAAKDPKQSGNPWGSVALIETLLRLSETENAASVRALFDVPMKQCPEVLFISLAQVRSTWSNSSLRRELISVLSTTFFGAHPNAAVVHKLWLTSSATVVQGLRDMYMRDRATISHVLDVAHGELKTHATQILPALLDSRPFVFAIDLASLASQREYLNLELWLQDKLNQHGEPFARACLGYLKDKVAQRTASMNPSAPGPRGPVSNFIITPDVHRVFVNLLLGPTIPREVSDEIRSFDSTAAILESAATTTTPTPPPSASPAGAVTAIPSAPIQPTVTADQVGAIGSTMAGTTAASGPAEASANELFTKVYAGQISIEELIATLRNFRTSTNVTEREIFTCMINSLFNEYQYLQRYPEKELRITGIIFGALIQNQLVVYQPLGTALKAVLDAVRQPAGTKLFKFGIFALEQFVGRLHDWPQYSTCLAKLPHLQQSRPDIFEVAERVSLASTQQQQQQQQAAAQAQQQPSQAATTTTTPTPETGKRVDVEKVAEFKPSTGKSPAPAEAETAIPASLPIDTLRKGQRSAVAAPDTRTADRMHFIINNVSQSNLEQKAEEMRGIFRAEQHGEYLAQYLVTTRISIEPNNHGLYQSFIDAVRSPELWQLVLKSTYDSIRVLLGSERIRTEQSERTLLKTLGSWLGLITLARNKPITHNELPVKDILIQSVHDDNVAAVVSFVAAILSHCATSKVFKPPNPWVVALLKVLAEIYFCLPGIRQNTQFEIERLMTTLGQQIEKLRPAPSAASLLVLASTTERSPSASPAPQSPTPGIASGGAGAGASAPAPSATGTPVGPAAVKEPGSGSVQKPDVPTTATTTTTTTAAAAAPVSPQQPPPQPTAPGDMISAMVQSSVSVATGAAMLPQVPAVQLTAMTVAGIEKAIRDIITPVVERSVAIGCVTTRDLVGKDFALELDEGKLRKASHQMAQCLAGSLALVTCKEPLKLAMTTHLTSLLVHGAAAAGIGATTDLEQVAAALAADNLEAACSIVEKAASEKAVHDTDEALAQCYAARRKYREARTAQFFVDMPFFQARAVSQLPEPLRVAPGGLTPQQLAVYDEFANVPHGQPSSPAHSGRSTPQDRLLPLQAAIERFNGFLAELDSAVSSTPISSSPSHAESLASLSAESPVHRAVSALATLFSHVATPADIVPPIVQLLFSRVIDPSTRSLMRDAVLAVLEAAAAAHRPAVNTMTTFFLASPEERRLSRDVVIGLVRSRLVLLGEIDLHLARLLEGPAGRAATEVAAAILRECVVESKCVGRDEIPATIDAMARLAQRGFLSTDLAKLTEEARIAPAVAPAPSASATAEAKPGRGVGAIGGGGGGATGGPTGAASAELREQVAVLFHDWCALTQATRDEKAYAVFVQQLQQQGVLRTDDHQDLFFRVCTEVAVEAFGATAGAGEEGTTGYAPLDAYSRLVVVLLKQTPAEQTTVKTVMLGRVLSALVKVLLRDHDDRGRNFDQRPYQRLLDTWLVELQSSEQQPQQQQQQQPQQQSQLTFDATNPPLNTFCNLLAMLNPGRVPGFTFAWLELISHRMFMPKLLLSKSQKLWPFMQRLLVDLLHFLDPHLRAADMSEPLRALYKGTLRVFLVLLHDFPEFLCDFHFSFCDAIPPTCIQLRNLILSAFPRNMRLPDPFTPNLKVDLLPEIQHSPRVLSPFAAAVKPILPELDSFLRTCQPASFLIELRSRLLLPPEEATANPTGTRYNVAMVNSLILYVGTQAIAHLQNNKATSGAGAGTAPTTPPIAHNAPMDIFQHLAIYLDMEGRYLFLNSIANQLRYPNTHTHYFSCVLLYLFAEASSEVIQEQITRVLLERLVVNRPHPWGLLITFIELIKNPRYNFWSHGFVRCAPEIERLFESVARSCMQPQPPPS